ncbi:MAG TPA: glycosyltransferase [Candidatus Baltobacteraceae bacterium]|jgi:glycosyltransferase involved in cell wall biosynthesis|nr:glycosyltransferase [Candidatus Baltobacteraceae bacterium]
MSPRFSVIIPAHNEECRIEATLRDYSAVFNDSEIIVVLNGCTDRTAAIVAAVRAQCTNICAIEIEEAVGKGGAVRAGFLIAQAPVVAYADADHATTAAEMRRLCQDLGNRDALIASRWLPGAVVSTVQPFRRRIASRAFNAIIRVLFGFKYSDTQCGAKVFRAASIARILPYLETANFAFDVDLLFTMKAARMSVGEAPTVWRDVGGSSVQLVPASAHMLASVLRLRFRHSFMRIVIPLFDRLFPTRPMRAHDGFRILMLNWRDPMHPQAGGAEIYLYEMAKRWVSAGHSVEWLCASFPSASKRETLDGIRITRAGSALTVYLRLPFEYVRSFRDRFDVIIDAENGIPFFSPLFSMKPKIGVVHHVHKDVFKKHLVWPLAAILTWLECSVMPRVYRNCKFVAVSEDTRSAMVQIGIPRQSIDIVRNGVDAGLKPGPKSAEPSMLYLGRLKAYKRIEHLIDALSRVRERVPDTVLHIAGEGDHRGRLEAYARERGVEDAVRFHGFVDSRRKRELLQGAWLFASASEMEGWGISVAEANACGTPAVAYNVPGLREVIRHGYNGIIVQADEDLSVPMIRILQNPQQRAELERNAIARAAELSWDRSAEAMMDVITHAVIGDQLGLVRRAGQWNLVKSRVCGDGTREAVQKVLA